MSSEKSAPPPAASGETAARPAARNAEHGDDVRPPAAAGLLANAPSDDADAPVPPSRVAASYEEMDAALKAHARLSDCAAPPPPPGQAAAAAAACDDADDRMAEIVVKKTHGRPEFVEDGDAPPLAAQIAERDEDIVNGALKSEETVRDSPAVDRGPVSRSPQPPSPMVVRPPPPSMRTPAHRDSSSKRIPILEARLVEEGEGENQLPVCDAVAVRIEDEDQLRPWWKRRATLGMAGVIVALVVIFGAVLGSQAKNDGSDGNESGGSDVIEEEPGTPSPTVSSSPSASIGPSFRPTPLHSSGPSVSIHPSFRPTRFPTVGPSLSVGPTFRPTEVPSTFYSAQAKALARTIWNDASGNYTWVMFDDDGWVVDCTWKDDDPCVQHATLLGGSEEAYDTCDDAMIRAFADPRLDRGIAEYILFNSEANIPMSDCTSLLSYSAEREGGFGDRGAAVAAAREVFVEGSP